MIGNGDRQEREGLSLSEIGELLGAVALTARRPGRNTAQAMSRENVEVVRSVIDAFQAAWERGDAAAFDPIPLVADAEWIPDPELVGPAVYRGVEGFIAFIRTWTEDFEGWTTRLEQLINAGEDRVVALMHQSGTGKGSGAPVETHYGAIFELEEQRYSGAVLPARQRRSRSRRAAGVGGPARARDLR